MYQYLTDVNTDSFVQVVCIQSGRNAKMRLSHLGIVPGVLIKKIQNAPFRGPVAIEIENKGRLIIGYGLAQKIQVCNPN